MENLINLFIKEHGLYKDKLKLIIIIAFILMVFIYVKYLNTTIIIIFFCIIYILDIIIKIINENMDDYNKNIIYKLEQLQLKVYNYIKFKFKLISASKLQLNDKKRILDNNKLDSLYIDSDIIIFLYSIIDLSEYNLHEFYILLKGTNNLLKIKHDIQRFYKENSDYPENISEMIETTIQLKSNCMNNLHNFIYSVPKLKIMNTYIDNILETYNILITKNINDMYDYHLDYIKIHGINNKTIFINHNNVKNYDAISNHSVISSKINNHKLIDLYI